MNLNEYQSKAIMTSVVPKGKMFAYATAGLVSEVGEFHGKLAKDIRGDGKLESMELALELGDVLWMLSALAGELGYSMDQIAQMNLDKLADRAERGVIQGSGDER